MTIGNGKKEGGCLLGFYRAAVKKSPTPGQNSLMLLEPSTLGLNAAHLPLAPPPLSSRKYFIATAYDTLP